MGRKGGTRCCGSGFYFDCYRFSYLLIKYLHHTVIFYFTPLIVIPLSYAIPYYLQKRGYDPLIEDDLIVEIMQNNLKYNNSTMEWGDKFTFIPPNN